MRGLMGATDIERAEDQRLPDALLGATVVPVTSGSATLKDALNEAMRDWVTNVRDTFYIIGTVAGPDPYPRMVRDFNAIVGREARAQMLAEYGRLPDAVIACVGGGSNAIGIFHAFLNDRDVRLVGAEAAGEGIATGHHRASLAAGRPGVLHGNRTYVLCDDDGQDHRNAFGCRPAWTIPASAPSTHSSRTPVARNTSGSATTKADRIPPVARCEGILRHWSPAMRSRRQRSWRGERRRTQSCCATCRVAATRTCTTIAAREGIALADSMSMTA